jgi:ribosomal protein L11 methyltransferase
VALPGQATVVLEPGLSFGTGQHPTTSFCLRQIVACRPRGVPRAFLDIGTGSGILAIAAAKLGYAPVHALDSDSVAVRVARNNASVNRQGCVRISHRSLRRLSPHGRTGYDLICANLTADVLLAEIASVLSRLKPDGRLVLAGILRTQFPSIRKAYAAASLTLLQTKAEKEWQSGIFAHAMRSSKFAPRPKKRDASHQSGI